MSGADTTLGWVLEREVENFKTQRRTRIQHTEKLAQLPPGGEAEHFTFDVATVEEYKIQRFARQFVVDGQDLINDDTDSLVQPALALGRAALQMKLDLIYSILLANANLADSVALFASGHNNLNTTAALAAATLDAAIASLKVQQENGADLGLVTRHIVVPPELEGLARRLVRDMETRNGPTITVQGEPRLSNGVTDPTDETLIVGSATTWFTAANSDSAPMIEFGFIDSNRPELRSWESEEGVWGVGYSVKWSIGAKALDFRGMVKNTA